MLYAAEISRARWQPVAGFSLAETHGAAAALRCQTDDA